MALAQSNATVGDFEGNVDKVLEGIERAREQDADLVAFPELFLAGYPPEDLLLKPSFLRANEQALQKVASQVSGITAVVGYAHLDGDLYNAAAVCADGEVKGVYHKHFLPTYGVFDEDRYFKRGTAAPVFVVAGTRVGVCVCEDIWYPSGPAEWASWAGAEVIVNVNGSPYRVGIDEFRRRMLATRAADYVVSLAYVNMVGGQDELVFDGASLVFDADGEVIASSPAFEDDLLVVDIDVDAIARERLHDPRMRKVSRSAVRNCHARCLHFRRASRPDAPRHGAHRGRDRHRRGDLSRARTRRARLPPEERLHRSLHRGLGRHRLGADGSDSGGRTRVRRRHRCGDVLPVFLGALAHRRLRARTPPRDPPLDLSIRHPHNSIQRALLRHIQGKAGSGPGRPERPSTHPRACS